MVKWEGSGMLQWCRLRVSVKPISPQVHGELGQAALRCGHMHGLDWLWDRSGQVVGKLLGICKHSGLPWIVYGCVSLWLRGWCVNLGRFLNQVVVVILFEVVDCRTARSERTLIGKAG